MSETRTNMLASSELHGGPPLAHPRASVCFSVRVLFIFISVVILTLDPGIVPSLCVRVSYAACKRRPYRGIRL